jgi:hypothetical protein
MRWGGRERERGREGGREGGRERKGKESKGNFAFLLSKVTSAVEKVMPPSPGLTSSHP